MLLSMTGFSSINIVLPYKKYGSKKPKTSIYVMMTLKTLNSRFFELNCKQPVIFTQLETYLIKDFKQKLHRGSIYFTLSISNPSSLSGSIEPSTTMVKGYLDSIEKIKRQFNIEGSLTISDIINLPNVFETQEELPDKEIIAFIIEAIDKLTIELIKTRITEGKVLEKDIKKRIELLSKYIKEIESDSKKIMEIRKNDLTKIFETAMAQLDQTTMTETQSLIIYNQLEKIAIHEEIVRFRSHLDNLINIINSSESEKGKKLDFTVQELFREINTIAAKCNDAKISSTAINVKVELEKAREQAQNIV